MSTREILAEAKDNESEHEPVIRRAFAAYYRSGHRDGYTDTQITIPANTSYVADVNGKRYVVLENENGIVAVYRVRKDGALKGLKRWPKEIDEER